MVSPAPVTSRITYGAAVLAGVVHDFAEGVDDRSPGGDT